MEGNSSTGAGGRQVDSQTERGSLRLAQRNRPLADTWYFRFPLCLIFTLGMIYSYVLPLGAEPFTSGIKGEDCGQMIWNIWFANEAITHGHNPYRTNLIYYPLGANLSHHTLAPGFFPITFIVKTALRGNPLYPFYAYRVIILVSFTLLLYFSYLLLQELGFSRIASAAAAVAYTFSDFYRLHFIHINHLAGFFIPLTALLLVRSYKQPKSAAIVGAAMASAVAVYFTEFAIYIYLAGLLLVIMLCLLKPQRQALISRLRLAGPWRLLTVSIAFLIVISPFVFELFTDRVRKPPFEAVSHYSANLAGFFIPGQDREQPELWDAPYANPFYGQLFAGLDSRITVGIGGVEVFLGFPLLIFSLVAFVRIREPLLRICCALSLIFFALSLGPTLKVFGAEAGIPMPYTLLMNFPPFDSGRTPVRFVSAALFFLMIVGAAGFSLVERTLTQGKRQKLSAIMLLPLAWTIAEAYSPVPRREAFRPPVELARIVDGPVLNLPPMQLDGYAAMLQTQHHQPIATGFLARNNEAQWAHFEELKRAFDKGGTSFCNYVSRVGFRNLVIAPASVTAPYRFSMLPLDLGKCPINVLDLRGEDASSRYNPNQTEQADFPLLPIAKTVHLGQDEADPYLWYGWSGREPSSHWTDRGRAAITFSVEKVQDYILRLRMAPFLAPPKLARQRVEIRLNGRSIVNLELAQREPSEYSFELPADILRGQNVLSLDLPDADSPKALGVSEDGRLLGINVQWLRIDPQDTRGSK